MTRHLSEDDAVKYAVMLMRKNTDALGFIPRNRLREYHRSGRLLIEFENDEPCGYLAFGISRGTARIHQACIQFDARRRLHGLALVERLYRIAAGAGCSLITLRCRHDLPANEFWRIAGFDLAESGIPAGKSRGGTINRWSRRVGAWLWGDCELSPLSCDDGITPRCSACECRHDGGTGFDGEIRFCCDCGAEVTE